MSNCLYNDKLVSVRCFFTYSCSLFANLNAVVGREDVCFGFLVIKLPKILHDVCIDSALSSVTSVMCLCLNQKCTVLNYYFFFSSFFSPTTAEDLCGRDFFGTSIWVFSALSTS